MRLLLLVALAACGRSHFDLLSSGDGGTDGMSGADAGTPIPVTVRQTKAQLIAAGNPFVVTFGPTAADSMIVVMSAQLDNSAAPILTLTDDASNVYMPSGATYIQGANTISETWFASHANAGATTITITDGTLSRREIWVIEAQGPVSVDRFDVVTDQTITPMVAAPTLTPSKVPALVVAQINISGNVDSLAAGPFTGLPPLNGDATAYAIATDPGEYTAAWNNSVTGLFSASTVVFKTD